VPQAADGKAEPAQTDVGTDSLSLEAITSASVQTDMTGLNTTEMELPVQKYYNDPYCSQKKLKLGAIDIIRFVQDDSIVRYYSGLPNFKV
jgi:hypothetical protein